MKLLKTEIREGKKYWEVENPRGFSARWGDVYQYDDGSLVCRCIQFQEYNHCSHADFIAGHSYTKGEILKEVAIQI